jgi:dTDP-4-amino-4,6-dideoxygalactose transaminase
LPHNLNRVDFMEQMKLQGIQTSIHYPPVHKFTSYQEFGDSISTRLPITESVAGREVTLPLYPAMTNEDVALVVRAIVDSLVQAKEVHSH